MLLTNNSIHYRKTGNFNIAPDVLDEIALEGLDGITIKTLFWRLSNRDNSYFNIDEYSKIYIWRIVLQLRDVTFYLLPTERNEQKMLSIPSLKGKDRIDLAVAERELYPINQVPSTIDAGSCEHYNTRKDISAIVREKSLEDALLTFGSKLVVVANRKKRLKALCSDQVFPDHSDILVAAPFDYVFLEAIGRARWHGLNTAGPGSARTFSKDSRQSFYHISLLVTKGLVNKVLVSGSYRLYLTRFNDLIEKHFDVDEHNESYLLQQLILEFQKSPNMTMTIPQISAVVPSFQKKKKRALFLRSETAKKHFVEVKIPNLQGTSDEKGDGESSEKNKVRVLKLINHKIDDDQDIEDCNDRSKADLQLGTPFSIQLYREILKAGNAGFSITQLCERLDAPRKVVNFCVRKLQKNWGISSFPQQIGRQRTTIFKISEKEMKKVMVKSLQSKLEMECEAIHFTEPSTEETQVIEEVEEILPQLKKETESSRKLLRIGFILRVIKTHRVLLKSQISNKLKTEEKEKGYKDIMDRRTLSRILEQLVSDGLIKTATKDNSVYYMELSFNIDELNSEIKTPETKISSTDDFIHQILVESEIEMDKLKISKSKDKGKKTTSIVFSNSPKFLRLSVLHDLMFYLVRGYTGDTLQSQEDLLDQLESSGMLKDNLRSELPRLFSDHISPYMFIPPLSSNHAKIAGWCTFAELLLSTPLSVYRELVGIPKDNVEFEAYLKHPILRHIPVSLLPIELRSLLLCAKPIGKIMVDVKRLCFMGLIRFGSKFQFRKLHLRSLYVNIKASILDTRTSAPGYLEVERNRSYERISFNFHNLIDVKNYWRELFTICLETKLGVGRSVSNEFLRMRESEKEAIIGYCNPVTYEEAIKGDTGAIPGDKLGAGGLDTSMFSFYRTNWFNSVPKKKIGMALPLKRRFKQPRKRSLNTVKKVKIKKRDEDDDDIVKNKIRVHWTKKEDNIVMICKVGMNFICPVQRSCIKIPISNVRTILHKYASKESKDKTTSTITRRILNISKSHRAAILGFVKMLQRSPESKVFTEKCPPSAIAQIKTNSADLPDLKAKLSAVYLELVDWLVAKYIDNDIVLVLQDLEIPDTIEQFNNQFAVCVKGSVPFTEQRIKEDSIRAVLLSSLASATDKTSHATQLFEVYRQYSESLLRTTIRRLHRQRVISFRKRGNEIPRLASTSPYQFSQRFGYLLNTKYNQSVYHDAYRELNLLLCCPIESHMEMNLSRCGPASFVLAGLGYVSLRTCVPEQFIVLDTQLVSADVSAKIMSRYEELLKHSDPISAIKEGKTLKRPMAIDDEDSETEIKKAQLTENDESPIKVNSNQMQEIRVSTSSIPDTMITLSTNKEIKAQKRRLAISNDDSQLETKKMHLAERKENEAIEKMDFDSAQASSSQSQETRISTCSAADTPVGFRSARIALYLLREIATREIDPTQQSTRKPVDVFVVNTSKVQVVPGPNLSRDYGCSDKTSKEILQGVMARSNLFQNLTEENFDLENILRNVLPGEAEIMRDLANFIAIHGSIGITLFQARNYCSNSIEMTKRLEEAKVIFRLGVSDIRLISRKFVPIWVVNSYKLTRLAREKMKPSEISMSDMKNASVIVKKLKDKGLATSSSNLANDSNKADRPTPVQVLMRPWLRVDGTVNRRVLDRLLGSALGFIMLNPGALASTSTAKFSPALTPVWTLELIGILEDIGCLSRRIIERQKPTLFTQGNVNISEKITGFELADEILVEPKLDAIIRLGKFIGNKSYSKDILTNL